MLESFNGKEGYTYQKLTEEEQQKRGILGRLVGPIADTQNPTRNGRKYNTALWEAVFDDDIMKEKIRNRAMFGELGHPEDREEVDMEKIAVCLAEPPKKGKDGLLYGTFDILSTPNGRILKTLCDYGTTVGISSRGTGDIITDEEGNEIVDPDTYNCECFDIVIVPAMEKARLQYVTEGLSKQKTLKQALTESLEKSSENDKRIMEETLKELNIEVEDNNEETREDKEVLEKEVEDEKEEVKDNESLQVVKDLQEALRSKAELETQLQKLQEEKAISDTKVSKLEEELKNFKNASVRLSSMLGASKSLKQENQSLKEQLEKQEELIKSNEEVINNQKAVISEKETKLAKLSESLKKHTDEVKLNESLSNKEVTSLKEQLSSQKSMYDKQVSLLTEKLNKVKVDSQEQVKTYLSKIDKSNKLVEKLKSNLELTVNKYIESKALEYGVKTQEIVNRLNESYTLEDVDKVCEDLKSYNLRMNKLPFILNKDTKVVVKESKKSKYVQENPNDDVKDLTEFMGL